MSLPASLFLRVYGLALGLSVLSFALVTCAMWGLVIPALDASAYRAVRWMGRELVQVHADPARAREAAESLREEVRLQLTIYSADGSLLATNVEPPLPPPTEAQTAALGGRVGLDDGDRWIVDLGDGLVGVALDTDPIELRFGTWVFGAALVALAIVAWPVAASMSRPLRRLGDVVDRFGAGDLRARSRQPGGDEIGQLAMRFDQMADRIVALLGEERLWMAGMSHEFRTPLQRLRLALEVAEDADGALSPAEIRALHADVAELDQLVTDVLAAARFLARPEDRLRNRERVDVAVWVAATCARAGLPAPGVPEGTAVIGDPRLLGRALLNLLRNAAEHAAGAAVEVSVDADSRWVTIRVADRGPGVPPTLREGVWAPFARGGLAPAEGRGIGLALVRQIALSHGGRVGLEDHGPGAVFVLVLPAAATRGDRAP